MGLRSSADVIVLALRHLRGLTIEKRAGRKVAPEMAVTAGSRGGGGTSNSVADSAFLCFVKLIVILLQIVS